MICKKHEPQLKDGLRRQKLRATPTRLRLLDIFKHAKKPLSAGDLAEALGTDGTNASTVYRNVEALTTLGLLKKIGLGDRQAYYELSDELSDHKHHHHLICQICHKVADVTDCRVSQPGPVTLRNSGFAKITEHSLEFFGLCRQCVNKI